MISFSGTQFPKDVILYAVFFYVRYGVSYRDVEEIFAERNVKVDHSTLNRWVIKYSSSLALAAKKNKRVVATSWRMDETYIQVKGQWVYLYRAVDKLGDTVDFMLSEKRDEAAATAFFKQAIDNNGFPKKVVMDKSGANYVGLENINFLLMLAGIISFVEILQIKYLNNLVEQDHRFIKKITKPMMDFKAFHSAKATIDGSKRHI
jgi:putative transposase